MINDIEDARDELTRYRGSNTTLTINYTSIPITFLNIASTGNDADDQLTLTWIWRSNSGISEFYDLLRDNVNGNISIRVGRNEFFAQLVDTTTFAAGEDPDESSTNEFEIVLTEISGLGTVVESNYKSAILALNVGMEDFTKITDYEHPEFTTHITLVYCPGGFSDDEMKAISKLVSEMELGPFEVDVTGKVMKWGPNNDNEYAYVAEVRPTNEIVSLRNKLIECIASVCGEDRMDLVTHPDFRPHVTITYSVHNDLDIIARPTKWLQSDVSIFNKEDNPTRSIPLVRRASEYTSLSYESRSEKVIAGVRYSSQWQEKRSGIADLIVSSLINRIRETSGIDATATNRLARSALSVWRSPNYDIADLVLVNPELGHQVSEVLGSKRRRSISDLVSEFEAADLLHVFNEVDNVI